MINSSRLRLDLSKDSNHNSTWIGEDLFPEIFKRLPIETLCRFRCVCRWWNSLISSPFFSSSTTPANLKPYLVLNSLISLPLYRPQKTLAEHLRHNLHFPFRLRNHPYFTCVDVIHGVVCLSYSLNSPFDSTIIWNPTLHKYVALPRLPFPLDLDKAEPVLSDPNDLRDVDSFIGLVKFDCNAICFGYDSSNNDFKVVRIWIPNCLTQLHSTSLPPTYEVYSARDGLWRVATADNIKSGLIVYSKTGCFVNGSIHWLIIEDGLPYNSAYSVLAFDCEREVFRTMELPQQIYMNEESYRRMVKLLEYGGMLSALVYSYREDPSELWVMEEYGVTSSWKKLYSLSLNNIDAYQSSFGKLAPYGPNQWTKLFRNNERFEHIVNFHVYEESLFFIGDTKAQSYTKKKIVHVHQVPNKA